MHPLLLWVMLFCSWELGKEEEGPGICTGVGVEIRVWVSAGFGGWFGWGGVMVGVRIRIRVGVRVWI